MLKKIIIILLFVASAIAIYVASSRSELVEKFSGIRIISVERDTKGGEISTVDSTGFTRYTNSVYVIYKLPKIVYKNHKTKVFGDSIDLQFTNPDTTFTYFVIKKNETNGVQYDNDLSKAFSFSLDSLMKEVGLHPSMMGIYNLDLGNPLIIEKKRAGIEIEKFLNKKIEKNDPDSIYRYFNRNLSGIDFTYSSTLDKIKDSKLFRTSFIYLGNENTNNSNKIKSEFYSCFEKIDVVEQKKLVQIIEKFRNTK